MLGAEMDVHLGEASERQAGNHRNGTSRKTVDTGSERIVVVMSADRQVSGIPTAPGSGSATVSASDYDGDTDSLSFAWTVVPRSTGRLTATPNPSTGNYIVSGSFTTSRTYEWISLIETAPGGATTYYDVHDASDIRQSFSERPAGMYSYRVEGCYFEEHPIYPEAI